MVLTRKWAIWRRIAARLELENEAVIVGERPTVSLQIVPVFNIDDLLRNSNNQESAATDLSAAAGTYVAMLTVPDGKRWYVRHMYRSSTVANSEMLFSVNSEPVQVSGPGTAAEAFSPGQELVLDEGDTMGMLTTGNGGDTGVTIKVHYLEEDAF